MRKLPKAARAAGRERAPQDLPLPLPKKANRFPKSFRTAEGHSTGAEKEKTNLRTIFLEKLEPLFGKNGTKKISLRRENFSVPAPKRKNSRPTFFGTMSSYFLSRHMPSAQKRMRREEALPSFEEYLEFR